MERPGHRRNNPSFSSSLLDAIYRSIDDESSSSAASGGNLTAKHKTDPEVTVTPAVTRPRRASTSSSSDSSSSYFSSSSDADSARPAPVRPKVIRTGPILTRSDQIRSDPPPTKKAPTSIKKKLRDLRKSTSPSPSSSPGAKLAGFLNSLFTASSHKKAKFSTAADDVSPSPSSWSSAAASSSSRSCLSKTPSTRGSRTSAARSVRFCPVGVIVGEDCRPCGEKVVVAGEDERARERRRRRMVEELMKGFEMEVEEEESGDESDGSEDLFELQNLAGISGGGRFRDELPVYGTTDLGINCAIAKGLLV